MSRHPLTPIPPAAPRKWLATVRDILTPAWFTKFFHVDNQTVIRWIADPIHVSESSVRTNYLERHEAILTRLMNDGYEELARSNVSRLAAIVGCALVPLGPPTPDKETIEQEMLDDLPPLVALQEAIIQGKSMDDVRFLGEQAKGEIDETVEFYRLKKGTHNSNPRG